MELGAWLASSPAALIVACALLGLLVGSFLNVVILRLPARLQHEWEAQSREILALDVLAERQGANPAFVAAQLGVPESADPLRAAEHRAAAADALEPVAADTPPDLVFTRSHCPK